MARKAARPPSQDILAMYWFLEGFRQELGPSFETAEGRRNFVNAMRSVADLFDPVDDQIPRFVDANLR